MAQRKHRLKKSTLFCLVLLLFGFAGCTQPAKAQTSNQLWPEIDVYIDVKPKIRLFFLGTTSKGIEDGELIGSKAFEAQFAANIDYLPSNHMVFRTGYLFGTSLGDTDSPYKEHRLLTEQTFRKLLKPKLLISDRSREDFRFVNGDFSFRYRNRLKVEREFQIRKRSFIPYASGEIFYDTQYSIWNRNRLTAGVQMSLRRGSLLKRLVSERQVMLDLSFTRQNDSRSSRPHVHGMGVTMTFYF
jgi:hypothetical protein